MKLIMENWRNYQDTENSLIIFENQIKEEVDILLTEGILDLVASAYERAKDGALKLKDAISDKVKAALERVNDFFLKMAIKAMDLAKTSIEATMRVAKSMNSAIERFQKNHPILYNIVKAVIFMIVIAAVIAVFSSEASATVKLDGGQKMSEDRYNAIRGFLNVFSESTDARKYDMDLQFQVGRAITNLDIAYKTKSPESINKLSETIQLANRMVEGYVSKAQAGNADEASKLAEFIKIGKNLKVYESVTSIGVGR